MQEETTQMLPALISDLGLILITAAAAALLFKKIRQPLVLGYLIAGYLAGPHFSFFPSVTEQKSIDVWAEIGVIFVLFSLGLEFSFKKLLKVGGTSAITSGVQLISMIGIGFLTGLVLGWETIDSIFLGAMLAMSSTTIILRAFDELNLKGKKFAGIVFGALIIEDIVAILMMVLLATISVSQKFSGVELFDSVLKLVFFLILWFLAGIFVIPTLLKKSKNLLNEESLLLLALGLCLMMVISASAAGFSSALGAFIMGSIIAETIFSERIIEVVKPVKHLFGAVFFVSVGMMINPQTLVEYAVPVVIITLVTIFGKTTTTFIGSLISGQPLKQAVQVGSSLSQIGEFSFIIATLGMTLKVTSDFLYPVIVAVSAITTFLSPFFIKGADGFAVFLEKILPQRVLNKIEEYSANAQRVRTANSWQKVLKANVVHIVIHTVVIIAIILLSDRFIMPLFDGTAWGRYTVSIVTLLALLPFFWALSARRVAKESMMRLREERKLLAPLTIIIITRITLTFVLLGLFLNIFFNFISTIIALLVIVFLALAFPKTIQRWYHRLERHFISNLNSREIHEAQENKSDLTPWDGHMTTFKVPQEAYFSGQKLIDLQFREHFGINIAVIKRGNITINIPDRNECIFPDDLLYVIGTDDQIIEFSKFISNSTLYDRIHDIPEITLQHFDLQNPAIIGKTIRACQLRERTNGLVVGLERDGERIINPKSDVVLRKDDILWIVGDKTLLRQVLLEKERERIERLTNKQA